MLRTRFALAILALIALVLAPSTAIAATGSLIRGVVWADVDRDGVHDAAEPLKSGITVQLVRATGGAVVASTTTDGQGVYRFDDVADGSYQVRVTAPGAFDFPDTATGDNVFVSTGRPAPGAPEVGTSPTLTIAGGTQATGTDAGMQPTADLNVQPLPMADACQGLATTGTPPFDSSDGSGKDSGTSNCLVRTNDTETQRYAVSLTGLPTGASVDNVILDLTITSDDGAFTELAGPGTNGLPTGCLINGVTPASSVTTNPDGSVSVRCNLGTFTSAVKAIQLVVRALNSSSDTSHFHVEATASAPAGDSAPSDNLVGPDIEVTGIPQWDLSKRDAGSATTVSVQTINGRRVRGYLLRYRIDLNNTAPGGRGGRSLQLPLTFTDKLTKFPDAQMVACYPTTTGGDLYYTSGQLLCPAQGTPQGTDGWQLKLDGLSPLQDLYMYYVQVFVPEASVYHEIDPSWTSGDPIPEGSVPVGNTLINTDGWAASDGGRNNGTGFEPGWDGTKADGNNVVSLPLIARRPQPGPQAGSGKFYFSPLGGCCAPGPLSPGKRVGTTVIINTNSDSTITNPTMCDVFDVSVLSFDSSDPAPPGYVFEYAAGPNSDDLQTGPKNPDGLYPTTRPR